MTIGWVDQRRTELGIYAQRVSRTGALLWDTADVAVSRASEWSAIVGQSALHGVIDGRSAGRLMPA